MMFREAGWQSHSLPLGQGMAGLGCIPPGWSFGLFLMKYLTGPPILDPGRMAF